jgi:predicted alpha/beta-hydrolase family hydrolase
MAVAEGLPAAGLVLLSYPLHPPGRPEKLRVEHFGQITVPTVFVSGDKDPFGTPGELAEHVAAIPGSVTTVTLSGAHDMRGVAREKSVADAVAAWIATL